MHTRNLRKPYFSEKMDIFKERHLKQTQFLLGGYFGPEKIFSPPPLLPTNTLPVPVRPTPPPLGGNSPPPPYFHTKSTPAPFTSDFSSSPRPQTRRKNKKNSKRPPSLKMNLQAGCSWTGRLSFVSGFEVCLGSCWRSSSLLLGLPCARFKIHLQFSGN